MKKTLPRLSEYVKLIESKSFTETEKYAIIEWRNKCDAFDNILNYTNFITQQLNISHFVPAIFLDNKWILLEDPKMQENAIGFDEADYTYYQNEFLEYQTALDNVIFPKPNCGCYTEYDREGCSENCSDWINSKTLLSKNDNLTVESIIKYNLEITDKIAEKFKL